MPWFRVRDGRCDGGDLGASDPTGTIPVVARLEESAIRGGVNGSPRERVAVVMTHAWVAQVAVLGVPDAALGEETKAVVVRTALIARCKARTAACKDPRIVKVVAAMPMTATGKILKRAMRG